MSSNFSIYPRNNINISFGDLLEEFEKNIKDFFLKNDIHIDFNVYAGIYNNKTEHEEIVTDITPFRAPGENETMWIGYEFMVCDQKITDFTHVDFYPFDDYDDYDICLTSGYLFDDKQAMIPDIEERMPYIINTGGYWSFSGRAWPAYGFAAASFAKLTDGIIFSDTGAWDYSKFPCLAEDFLKFYYNINDLSNADSYIINVRRYLKEIKTYDYVINGRIKTYQNVKYDLDNLYVARLFLDFHYDIKPCLYDSYSYTKYMEINGDKALLYFLNGDTPIKIDSTIDSVNKNKNTRILCFVDNRSLFFNEVHDEKYAKRIKLKLYSLSKGAKKNKRNLQTVYFVSGDEILVFK
ncbi:hypothetical protein E4O03_05315 [Treponema sp. OMZ 792]|uniref:hypothetical protein n=1 Tax=unclassified Treponema TaxID=2638727 RepID=UPI0020A50860|nr:MULTISPECIES: hypothetical protein [unclassified Treponema]UTC76123.1 hypothetical protein E4O03_05315 [Treponema sp. OMZ 792]UTC80125.1 hypothetical protein E4O07_05340 [Treponema sp. OMZ 798]